MLHDTKIIIFAKPPVMGLVKTRLIPHYGARRATSIYLASFHRVLCTAQKTSLPIEVHFSEPLPHYFMHRSRRLGITVRRQARGDLGIKMRRATRNSTRAIIIGADCIGITEELIGKAAQALETSPAVFVSAEDGGYIAIGIANEFRQNSALIKRMPWGTSKVMQLTRSRADRLGLPIKEVGQGWDMDRPADVRRAKRERLL